MIAIEFESQDPELAARAANAVGEGYLALQRAAEQEQTRAARAWLSGEIDRLRAGVAPAESMVEQYRAKVDAFTGSDHAMLSKQQLGDFNSRLAAARAQRADAEVKAKLIRDALKAGTPPEFPEIMNSELMRRLSEQRVTLRAQLAEQSSTLRDQHPRIRELRAQIADLDRQIYAEADRLARALENDAKVADAKVNGLSAGLDQLKQQAVSSSEQEVQLRARERDAKSQRDLLESYQARYREAMARDSIGAAAPAARIISKAVVSTTPSWPKQLPTILWVALATFALASGFILSRQLLGANPARLVPPLPAGTTAVAEASRAADVVTADRALHDLGAALDQSRQIAVLGTVPSAGASIIAIMLARILAKQTRVVLIDLAPESSDLAAITDDPGRPGIAELIAGVASFGDVITRDRSSRLHVITAGRKAVDAGAINGSQRLSITLEALNRIYDHVVINAGTLGSLDRWVRGAAQAVLVAAEHHHPATAAARRRVLDAGFSDVRVVVAARARERQPECAPTSSASVRAGAARPAPWATRRGYA